MEDSMKRRLRLHGLWLLAALALAACQSLGGAEPTATAVPPTGTAVLPATAQPTQQPPTAAAPSPTPSAAVAPETPTTTGVVRPPPATLAIGEQTQAAGIGSYCWNMQAGGLCADMLGIITPLEALVVAEGAFTAQFNLPLAEAPSALSLNVLPATGEPTIFEGGQAWLPEQGGTFELQLEAAPAIELNLAPGLYVLALFTAWEGTGDVVYGFLVQVGEGGPSSGGPAFVLPASCLPSSPDLSPYVDPGGRYCVQFPAAFRIGDVTLDRVNFYGPPLDPSIEPVFASLSIAVEGPAAGRSLAQVVDEYVMANAQGVTVMRRPVTLGGEPAELVEGLPGRTLSWQVFVVRADTVYHFSLAPVDPALPQAQPDVDAAWQAAQASFTFLP
jgi:hypothetical protein